MSVSFSVMTSRLALARPSGCHSSCQNPRKVNDTVGVRYAGSWLVEQLTESVHPGATGKGHTQAFATIKDNRGGSDVDDHPSPAFGSSVT